MLRKSKESFRQGKPSQFIFIFGTTGELIKIFPLVAKFEEIGISIELWCTGQQIEELPHAISSLNISTEPRWLTQGRRGKSLRSKVDVILWSFEVLTRLLTRSREMRAVAHRCGGVVVHGDTMTTAIAALAARISGSRVIHVEAGMRSGDLRNPFPEELSRRFVARVADLHFAPGADAVRNLQNCRGTVVDTVENTIVDALRLAQSYVRENHQEGYGLVSLHRSELYENEALFTEILTLLTAHSEKSPLIFVDHPVTARRIEELGLDEMLRAPHLKRIPKLTYFDFIGLLSAADYVVTDSGGLQQECEVTGHPCLVHRTVTESMTRVGQNIVLSEMNIEVVREFLEAPEKYRQSDQAEPVSPTEIIVADLRKRGLCP